MGIRGGVFSSVSGTKRPGRKFNLADVVFVAMILVSIAGLTYQFLR